MKTIHCDICEKEIWDKLDHYSLSGGSLIDTQDFCRECFDKIMENISVVKKESSADIPLTCNKITRYNSDIDSQGLSVHSFNALRRAGFNTIKDVIECINNNERGVGGRRGLFAVRNIGKESYYEIYNYIENKGFKSMIKPGYKTDNDFRN